MNEHLSDDELVSSILDGEADDAARARLEADPALKARLASFRQVSGQVGAASGTPSEEGRDAAIAAALAASTIEGVTNVTTLATSARRPWLLAAAAVAAVAVLLPLGFLVSGNIGGNDPSGGEIASGVDEPDVEVPPGSTTPSDPGSGGESPGNGDSPDGRPVGPSNGMAAHLGDLPDNNAVATAVANYTATSTTVPSNPSSGNNPPATTPPTSSSPPATEPTVTPPTEAPPSSVPGDPGTGTPVGNLPCLDVAAQWEPIELMAEATYQGIDAVIVVRGTEPDRTAVVIDSATCEVITEVALEP